VKTQIAKLMRDIKRKQRELPKRKFPKIGTFANTKEYVEAYFQINQPTEYSLSCRYVENYHNLSTRPL
jgi:hypothetical protein